LSDGAWDVETGVRERARRALALASEKASALKSAYEQSRTPGAKQVERLIAYRQLLNDYHLFTDSAVVLAPMAIEGFLNFYGVVRFGEPFFKEYLERLPIHQKLAGIVAASCSQLLQSTDEIVVVVRKQADVRNQMVHPKTRVLQVDADLWGQPVARLARAREAVERMDRFFDLFLQIDPDASHLAHGA
jgi:hypothetical protein